MSRARKGVFVEMDGDSMPPDAVALDPDAQRAAELEAENVAPEDIEDLFKISEEMRTTGSVVLQFTRTLPANIAGYVGEMAPAEFTLERARQSFGIGTYKVRCMGPKGYVPGGGKLVIAPVPEKPAPPHSNVDDVLAILKADKEKSSERMKEWAVVLAPILAPVIQGFFQPKNQINELLQGMAALKGLTPEPKEPEPLSKQLDNLAGVMARLKEMSGDDKPVVGSTWIDLIREGVSGLRPVLEGVIAARSGLGASAFNAAIPSSLLPAASMVSASSPAAPGAVAGVGSAAGPAATSTSPPVVGAERPESNPMLAMIPWLRATLASLTVQASRDRDPALYAEVTLENLPLEIDPATLKAFVERPDWWQVIQQFDARVAPYVGWFTAFRREVLELMAEGEQATTPQPESPEPPEPFTPGSGGGTAPPEYDE